MAPARRLVRGALEAAARALRAGGRRGGGGEGAGAAAGESGGVAHAERRAPTGVRRASDDAEARTLGAMMAQIVQRNPLTDNVTPTVPTVGAAEQARETVPRVTLDQLRGLLANDGANADLLAAETGVSADDLRAIARTLTLPADVPR